MRSHILLIFTTLLLLASSATVAQDVNLSYTVDQITTERYLVEISAQAASEEGIGLKAVNFSLAFDLSCAHPTGYQTLFTDSWTTFLENALIQPGLELVHREEASSARWQFGSADPGLPATSSVDLPLAKETPLPIIAITFEGSCANDVFLENQKQNSLNQFADENMKLLSYEVMHPAQQTPFAFQMVNAFSVDETRTQLIWRTEHEKGGGRFEVEKSATQDFSSYAIISKEQAPALASQLNNYQFVDETEMMQLSCYRIRYIALDGTLGYSETVTVERGPAAIQLQLQATVFPNPTSDYVTVLMDGKSQQELQVRLTDLQGRQLMVENQRCDASGFAEANIDLRKYPQAIYIVEVSDKHDATHSQSIRIVKK